jgi:RHS repeat-associated protein
VVIDGPWANDTLTYTYDDLGRIVSAQLQNGQTTGHEYDDLGRLTKVKVGTKEYIYQYDGVSPLIKKLTRPNTVATSYGYDSLNRLSSQTSAGATAINSFSFSYNNQDLRDQEIATGLLPAPAETAGRTDGSFNSVNQLLQTASPDQTFVYDDDGNMTEGSTPEGFRFTAVYDEAKRLATITYTDAGGDVRKTKYTYRYDGFVGRIEKFKNSTLTADTRMIYHNRLPIQERGATNNVLRDYAWGANLGGGIGGLLQLSQGGADYTYLYDGRGNVVSVLDSSGQEVAKYRYDAFGRIVAKSGTFDQPFQFSTKRYDPDTGLSYYGYRFYSPAIERWMNRDPLGEEGGVNLYGFVANDPVNWIDPWGLAPAGFGIFGTYYWGNKPFTPAVPPSLPTKGPFGSICGPAGSNKGTWIPDLLPGACDRHDKCYDDCAKDCKDYSCKEKCDRELMWSSIIYGLATYFGGEDAYNDAKEKNGCPKCD